MKLTGREKVSYGLGAVGKDMVYMLSASYILYYYQDILKVSAIATKLFGIDKYICDWIIGCK